MPVSPEMALKLLEENKELKDMVVRQQRHIYALKERIAELEALLPSLMSELDLLRAKQQELEAMVQSLQGQVAGLEDQNSSLRKKLLDEQSKVAELQRGVLKLQQEKKQLELRLANAEKSIKLLTDKIHDMADLRSSNDEQLLQQADMFDAIIAIKNAEIQHLHATLQELRQYVWNVDDMYTFKFRGVLHGDADPEKIPSSAIPNSTRSLVEMDQRLAIRLSSRPVSPNSGSQCDALSSFASRNPSRVPSVSTTPRTARSPRSSSPRVPMSTLPVNANINSMINSARKNYEVHQLIHVDHSEGLAAAKDTSKKIKSHETELGRDLRGEGHESSPPPSRKTPSVNTRDQIAIPLLALHKVKPPAISPPSSSRENPAPSFRSISTIASQVSSAVPTTETGVPTSRRTTPRTAEPNLKDLDPQFESFLRSKLQAALAFEGDSRGAVPERPAGEKPVSQARRLVSR
eukprot:ANDGO_00522.mRNA.1 hypothetical protein